ncbi:hypothetical protein FKM82_005964 [Ascaphus truei]
MTVLNLGNNSFEKVPEQLKHLKSLQRLHLFGNKITEIPPAVFDGLENLISLNLNNNLLKQLPSEIRNLKLLENLSVNHNQLKEVPKELCTLQHLCELHLTNNHLETLPEELGYMTNLKELLVSRNKLIGLPEGLGKLKKLKILDVAGNEIRAFPSTEITARLILSHLKSTDSVLREKIKQHPKVRTILSNTNVCALCGQEFLDIWLECVKFVDVKKKMKKSSNLQLLPIRVLLCSYKCFNQQHNGIFGVAIQ